MDRETYYTAIHRNVLIVYVIGHADDWAAYVVPVPGQRHDDEQHLWSKEGQKMQQAHARAINGALCEWFDTRGLKWRA
jgi:hypothetical protein